MGLFFLLLVFFISVFRLFDTGAAGQLVSDGLVLGGLFALPVLLRRRRQGAEFLTSGAGAEPAADELTRGSLADERLRTQSLIWALRVWVLAAGLLYFLSLLVSQHTGLTLHACRQVVAGALLFSIIASFRLEGGWSLDLLLGLTWGAWLVVFVGPLWGPHVPQVWSVLAGPFPTLPVLPGEGEPPVVVLGVVALESWVAGLVLVSARIERKVAALAAHTLLWALWGVLGGSWLALAAAVTLLLTVASCPSRLKQYWTWASVAAFLAGVSWVAATKWAPWGKQLWSPSALWQPPFGESALLVDYRTALFQFPLGIGALGHEVVRSVFSVGLPERPVPGGQHLLWIADLGIFGPLLSAALIGLLVWSVRFVGGAYREGLDPSREPKALRSVKDSEYPLAPVVLPVTLLAWMAVTLSFRRLDLFRSPVFWVYLGLWVAWLAARGPTGEAKIRYRVWNGGVLVFAICFLLVAGMRELGRYYYHQALAGPGVPERKVGLLAAQYWDRWNPDYAFRLGRLALDEGENRAQALMEGRRWVERGLRLAPADGPGRMLLSRFERAEGRLPEAISSAEQAVFFAPDQPDLHRELGGLYESTGLLQLAAREYRSVLSLRPDDVDAHLSLARLAEKDGRYDEALEDYRRVLMLDRQHTTARARYDSLKERLRRETT